MFPDSRGANLAHATQKFLCDVKGFGLIHELFRILLPPSEFINTGLADRPIAATQWILTIDTSDSSNAGIDFTKLQDIIIRFTYTYGNPPEFSGF